jgi:hypothetical protein
VSFEVTRETIKQLQWLDSVRTMEETRISRSAFKLIFKGKSPTEPPRTSSFNQVLEDNKKRGKSWQEIEREILIEKRRDIGDLSSIYQPKRKLWQNKKICEELIVYFRCTPI